MHRLGDHNLWERLNCTCFHCEREGRSPCGELRAARLQVYADDEGLSPPHYQMLRSILLGVVAAVVAADVQIASLNVQDCTERQQIEM